MTIYVDKPAWPFKGELYGHMVADTMEELRAFAGRIGLHPAWIQLPPKATYPHFDINGSKHDRARRLGAVIADKRTLIEASKKLRAQFHSERLNLMPRRVLYLDKPLDRHTFLWIRNCTQLEYILLEPTDEFPKSKRIIVVQGVGGSSQV